VTWCILRKDPHGHQFTGVPSGNSIVRAPPRSLKIRAFLELGFAEWIILVMMALTGVL
jgi:hypothetical protein